MRPDDRRSDTTLVSPTQQSASENMGILALRRDGLACVRTLRNRTARFPNNASMLELLSTIGVAAGLGAAAGLRVFVPLLVASLACVLGVITPGHGMEWMATWWAVGIFAALSLVEVVAYHVPWLDQALDTIATPLAVVSGTVLAAAPILHLTGDSSHMTSGAGQLLPWAAAVVGGGLPAAGVQVASVATRATSSATTLGVANPLVATVESVGAAIVSILSVLLPVLAALLVLCVVLIVLYWARRRRSARARVLPAVG